MTLIKTTQHANDFEGRLGRKIAARLADTTEDLPHDISERLKIARVRALAKRKISKLQNASELAVSAGSTATHSGGDDNLWIRIASVLPLLALIAGLFAISVVVDTDRTNDMATIDTELLTDELPPDAYTDPGFAQFVRMNRKD